MNKNTIKEIIVEQKEIFEKDLKIVNRDYPKNTITSNKIVVITGVRRCGKSTLLRQISKLYEGYYYLNFEDERLLDFTYHDFNLLLESFYELSPNYKVFFFDEIQNIYGWEKFVRRLFNEGYKVFVTGSNATLLSSEIATALTGRHLIIGLYPFSFKEYLKYVKFPIKKIYTTKERAELFTYLKQYIKYGGFPEIVKSHDYEELNQIYQDIIIKDLIFRYKIRDTKEFRELALYLLSNTTKKNSYNNLKNLLNFSTTSQVKNYINYLSESFLMFEMYKFDYSVKNQIKNERKIYIIDHGLINAVSFMFSKNYGRIMENIVYLELKRRYHEIFYYSNKKECDFVIKKGLKITLALQVASSLRDPDTKNREIQGLLEAVNSFKLKKGFIITKDEQGKINNIEIVPLWKFLLFGLD